MKGVKRASLGVQVVIKNAGVEGDGANADAVHCRASMAHTRQSKPGYGLGFELKVLIKYYHWGQWVRGAYKW